VRTYLVYRNIIFTQSIVVDAASHADAIKQAKQHPPTDFSLKLTKHRHPWQTHVMQADPDKSCLEAQAQEAMKKENTL